MTAKEFTTEKRKSMPLQAYDTIDYYYLENRTLYRELGSSFRTPEWYLRQFKDALTWKEQKITFSHNEEEPIHRWTPYVEGFSFDFVKNTFEELKMRPEMVVLDPFAGSGTLNVGAKMLNFNSIGIEKNPFMAFVMRTKLGWDVNLSRLKRIFKDLKFPIEPRTRPPKFMLVKRQFRAPVLKNLLRIKEAIGDIKDVKMKDIFKLAFASILMECSNLKRAPSIGYAPEKEVDDNTPFILFKKRVKQIIEDLKFVQSLAVTAEAKVFNEDSRTFSLPDESVSFAVTSPPYLNAMDYIGNYKIEIGWLGYASSTKDFADLRNGLVVCDNVSRRFLKKYSKSKRVYHSDWLRYIEEMLSLRMEELPRPRRDDYPIVVRKYFDDLYQVIDKVYESLKINGQLVMVVGDSLICDVYVPTDLILVEIGREIGFSLDKLVVARHRRSGIRRSFKLRETISYLKKTA